MLPILDIKFYVTQLVSEILVYQAKIVTTTKIQGEDSKWGKCAFRKEFTCDMVDPIVVATGKIIMQDENLTLNEDPSVFKVSKFLHLRQ